MKPFGFGAKVSTKCASENTRVEELNLGSNPTDELVEAEDVIPLVPPIPSCLNRSVHATSCK